MYSLYTMVSISVEIKNKMVDYLIYTIALHQPLGRSRWVPLLCFLNHYTSLLYTVYDCRAPSLLMTNSCLQHFHTKLLTLQPVLLDSTQNNKQSWFKNPDIIQWEKRIKGVELKGKGVEMKSQHTEGRKQSQEDESNKCSRRRAKTSLQQFPVSRVSLLITASIEI